MTTHLEMLQGFCEGDETSRADRLITLDCSLAVCEYEHGINLCRDFSDGAEPVHVIMAHHDRVSGVPGGNDNGASCVVMLKLSELLDQLEYSVPVMLVWVDHEELLAMGAFEHMGSTHFARMCKRQILSCLVLDVVGIGDTINISSKKPEGEWLRQKDDFVKFLTYRGNDYGLRNTPPSDNMALKIEGVESLLLSVLPKSELDLDKYPKTWSLLHTRNDTAESCSNETMEMLTEVLYDWCLKKRD